MSSFVFTRVVTTLGTAPRCSRSTLMKCPLPYALATWQYPNWFERGRSWSFRTWQHSRESASDELSPSEKWNR